MYNNESVLTIKTMLKIYRIDSLFINCNVPILNIKYKISTLGITTGFSRGLISLIYFMRIFMSPYIFYRLPRSLQAHLTGPNPDFSRKRAAREILVPMVTTH